VLLIVCAVLGACAVVGIILLTLQDGARTTVAETPAARTATPPTSLPATSSAPVTTDPATSSEVVSPAFAEAMRQLGIPLDPQTGWVVAQGICIRLGQPEYDQFRLAEGIERLFPAVTDEQAHAFVAMAATSVCPR